MDSKTARKKRDSVLEDALFRLADSKFSESLIFLGGGALHFIYSSPRYSSDLDFIDFTLGKDPISYLNKLDGWGSQYDISRSKFISEHGVRIKVGAGADKPVLAKIEIDSRGAIDYSPSIEKFSPLMVKSPSDIYMDKIFANISRYVQRVGGSRFPFKPNDLFDLEYLVNNLGVENISREDILIRAEDYGQKEIVNNENISNMLNLIRNKDNHDFFRHGIEKTMMRDVYKLIDFNSKYFDNAANHFEQYLL